MARVGDARTDRATAPPDTAPAPAPPDTRAHPTFCAATFGAEFRSALGHRQRKAVAALRAARQRRECSRVGAGGP